MTISYIVQTDEGYLYPHPIDSAVSHTDDKEHAGHFVSIEDAHVTAQLFGYLEGQYQVIAVELNARRSYRALWREIDG